MCYLRLVVMLLSAQAFPVVAASRVESTERPSLAELQHNCVHKGVTLSCHGMRAC